MNVSELDTAARSDDPVTGFRAVMNLRRLAASFPCEASGRREWKSRPGQYVTKNLSFGDAAKPRSTGLREPDRYPQAATTALIPPPLGKNRLSNFKTILVYSNTQEQMVGMARSGSIPSRGELDCV